MSNDHDGFGEDPAMEGEEKQETSARGAPENDAPGIEKKKGPYATPRNIQPQPVEGAGEDR